MKIGSEQAAKIMFHSHTFTILDTLGRHNYRRGPFEADFDRPRLEIGENDAKFNFASIPPSGEL